jgi:hypothetical protein
MTSDTPPGWYPDPGQPSALRWWDGTAWTSRVAGPAVGGQAPADLGEEAVCGRRARIALLVAVPSQILGLVAFRVQVRELLDHLPDLDNGTGARPSFATGGWAVPMQLSGAVGIIAGVLFLLWFARSAANSQALGLPARRDPGAGVAGFLVPVINLWWPYQSTCDLFPPEDGHRSLVLRWFLLWMAGGFLGSIFSFVSLLLPGWEGWLLIAVPAALTALAALSARHVIAEVLASHEVLALR